MSDPPPSLDPKLSELRERFRERLPAYRDRLRDAEKRLGTDRSPAPLTQLRQVAHELIGVSGMLGFSGISRTAAALEEAADAAHILDFVQTLPEGLDAPVGELGMGLSGGQRQRICIARALAGRPDLLVLDEPTSALDGDSEAAIQRTLEELKGHVTMVVVAHRLSTLSICDRLVVFQDGRVAAVGTPEELMASSTAGGNKMRFFSCTRRSSRQARMNVSLRAAASPPKWIVCEVVDSNARIAS